MRRPDVTNSDAIPWSHGTDYRMTCKSRCHAPSSAPQSRLSAVTVSSAPTENRKTKLDGCWTQTVQGEAVAITATDEKRPVNDRAANERHSTVSGDSALMLEDGWMSVTSCDGGSSHAG